MHRLKRAMQSELIQLLLALIGLGGIIRLIALVLPPDSGVVKWMAVVYLGVIAICVATVSLRTPLVGLSNRLREVLNEQLRQELAAITSKLDSAIEAQEQLDQARRELALTETQIRNQLPSAENAYRYFADRYGIGYGRLDVECNIRSDGSALVVRKVSVEAYSEIGALDTMLLIPEPPPPGGEWDIDVRSVESLSPQERSVSLEKIAEREGSLSALLSIAPKLGRGESVSFEMKEELPPKLYAIDLTADELSKRKTPYDYFGWNIIRPVRRLSLEVYFPEGVKPEMYDREVRYASASSGIPDETDHREEAQRLPVPALVGPVGGRYVLKLDVEFPMVRLVYILRWKPLARHQ